MKRYVVTLLLIMLSLPMLVAQELNCRVVVNSDKIQGTNKEVFNTLQTAISEYMNDILQAYFGNDAQAYLNILDKMANVDEEYKLPYD